MLISVAPSPGHAEHHRPSPGHAEPHRPLPGHAEFHRPLPAAPSPTALRRATPRPGEAWRRVSSGLDFAWARTAATLT